MNNEKNLKMLVVDDRAENLIAMKKVLKPLNAEVYVANSGEEALALLVEYRFALILMDVQMPGMDGFETASLVREYDKTKYVPIIFITAINKDKKFVFEGYDHGAVDYLFKPIDDHVLRSKVKAFLELEELKNRRLETLYEKLQQAQQELEKKNKELMFLAHHDPLTELPNRLHFEQEMERILSHAKRHQNEFAVFFMDLDNFKATNDILGHYAGDLMLKEAAKRLRKNIRKEDFIARIGGDEFAAILTDFRDPNDAGVVAEKLIESLKPPCNIEGHVVYIKSSIGISYYPHAGQDKQSLMKNADMAMYAAKEKGGQSFQYFSDALQKNYIDRLDLEHALINALEKKEFFLVFHPIINLKTNQSIGVETLVRWKRPEHGIIPPVDFIPLAEETKLILPLGEWILREACTQFKSWYDKGYENDICLVNISAAQLSQSNFPQMVLSILEETGMQPERLGLELTETVIMENKSSEEFLHELSQHGIRILVDDFGTGYSSMSRLKNLPIDTLKVDKAFVDEVGIDKNNDAIVCSIFALANSLGLNVIAEGIENEQQLKFLVENGCKQGQGYYFCKPLDATEVEVFFKNRLSIVKMVGS